MEKIIIEEEFDDLEKEVRKIADKLNEIIDSIYLDIFRKKCDL